VTQYLGKKSFIKKFVGADPIKTTWCKFDIIYFFHCSDFLNQTNDLINDNGILIVLIFL